MDNDDAIKILNEARQLAARAAAKRSIAQLCLINPEIADNADLLEQLEEAYLSPRTYLARRVAEGGGRPKEIKPKGETP